MTEPSRGNPALEDATPFKKRRLLLQTCALGSVIPLTLLLPQRSDAKPKPLRIGVTGPFSGPVAKTGRAMRQGIEMALEDARSAGELPVEINGEPRAIEFLWLDNQSDPEIAVRLVTDAIRREGIELLLGGWHSSVALALMDAEAPYRIMHLAHLAESQYISHQLNQNFERYRGWFKGWPSSSSLAALYGEPLKAFQQQQLWRPANNRVGIMVEDTAYGRGWGEALRESLTAAGFDPLPYDLTALDQTDFGPLLDRYLAANVSLVAMTTTSNTAASHFVRQFQQSGVKALLLAHGLRWSSDWYTQTGNASDYVIAMDDAMPIALWQRWWIRRFRIRYKEMPSIAAAGFHYDYTRMAIRLLNNTGTLDFDTLTQALYRMSYKGVWHRYQFARESGPQALSPNEVMTGGFMEGFFFPMVQLYNGEARIIWPPKYADQHFQQPPWL